MDTETAYFVENILARDGYKPSQQELIAIAKEKWKRESGDAEPPPCPCSLVTTCFENLGMSYEGSPELEAMNLLAGDALKSLKGKREYLFYRGKVSGVIDLIKMRSDAKDIWQKVYTGLREVTDIVFDGDFKRGQQRYKSLVLELEKSL